MIVDRDIRRQAMVHLFRRMGGTGAEPHRMEDLEHEWLGTGLRRSDLPGALREMVQDNLLLVARDGSGKTYKLSRSGIEEISSERHAAGFLKWRRGWTLLFARWRRMFANGHRNMSGPLRDRRRYGSG